MSVRLGEVRERRLRAIAARKDVPVSSVMREAVDRYCEEEEEDGNDTLSRLADYVGAFESEGGQADRTGEAFTQALLERQRR